MTAAVMNRNASSSPLSMSWGIFASIVFHGTLVGLIIFGLPHVKKPPPIPETAITVEVIEVAEERQTNKPPVEAPPPKEPPKIEETIAKKKDIPKAPPKVEAQAPPKAVPVKAPPKPPKQVSKPKPPPPVEPLKKAEVEPEPKKEEVVEEEQPDQFASLLKNLQKAEEDQPDVPDINPKAQNPTPSPLAQFAQKMTMNEFDALRRQLARCWSIQAGARYAENLIVDVKLIVSRDRRVMSAKIVDQGRYSRDSFFRAAGDSAIRAVRSPLCDPLELPPQKYDLWKEMIVSFDPRDML